MATAGNQTVLDVPLTDLMADPRNTRQGKDEDLPRLAESLKGTGQLTPVRIRLSPAGAPKKFTLNAGHRRVEAARLLGWTTIRAIIDDSPTGGKDSFIALVADNQAHKPLTVSEEINAVAQLVQHYPDLTYQQIASNTGFSPSDVSKCLAIAACPLTLAALADGRLTSKGDAYVIAKSPVEGRADLITRRAAGSVSSHGLAATKPRKPQPTTEKLCRVSVPLTTGTRIVVSGPEFDLDGLAAALTSALEQVRKAIKEQIDIRTAERVWRDKSKKGA